MARAFNLVPLCLCLLGCFEKVDDSGDTPDTADSADSGECVPSAASVPVGVYGGVHYQLTVKADGSAELLGDCSLATVDATPLADGVAHWILTWQSGYGLPVQDTAAIETIDVVFDGVLCDGLLAGTLTFPDSTTAPVYVVLGAAAEIYACE